jgi:hypothetical protein
MQARGGWYPTLRSHFMVEISQEAATASISCHYQWCGSVRRHTSITGVRQPGGSRRFPHLYQTSKD